MLSLELWAEDPYLRKSVFKFLCITVSFKVSPYLFQPFPMAKTSAQFEWAGGLFFAFNLAALLQDFCETRLVFLPSPYPSESVDITKPLVWRHVCQRLGKKESKICAGLSVLVINLCQSQVLVHRKKKNNNSFRVIVCFLPIAIDPGTPMRFCCLTADV